MLKPIRALTFCFLALACESPVGVSAQASAPDIFPSVHGETLSGKAVELPELVKGRTTILILSFTRAAQEQTKAWGERLKEAKIPADHYQVLELEDVPRLFRGAVKSGIRRGIPPASQDSFILLFEGQNALKQLVHFQKDTDAYVLMVDGAGNIILREQGAVSAEKIAEIGQALAKR